MLLGVGSVEERVAFKSVLILTLLCIGSGGLSGNTSSTPRPFMRFTQSGKESTRLGNETLHRTAKDDDDQELHDDLDVLLTELRQISDKIEMLRKEHGQLANGVTEISNAVKDMNERSEHIKRKVKKMSKSISKTSHHHKLKSSLKNLQKDHRRILEAMMNSTLLLHPHRTSHVGPDFSPNGYEHTTKRPKECENSTESQQCTTATIGADLGKDLSDPTASSSSSTTPFSKASSSTHLFESNEEHGRDEDNEDKDNMIPEPVVEPQGKAESSKTPARIPGDCIEVIQMGNVTSGVYTIKPKGLQEPIKVWCDHTTQGGGWTMMVARFPNDPQENFNRNWEDYKKGFGDPKVEYWIGNEALHKITSNGRHALRLNITNWKDEPAWGEWMEFSVMGEEKGYTLSVGRYSSGSTAGDALKWHNGMKFSTPDADNDALMGGHCALRNGGGWWYRGYRGCYQAHPTGRFQKNPSNVPKKADKRNFDLGPVLAWQNWRGESFFPKTLFLMLRPVRP